MSSVPVPVDSVGPLVRDAMLSSPRTHPPEATVADARELFRNPLVLLLLVTRGDAYVGAVDRSDVDGRRDDETLGQLATRRVPEVSPDDTVAAALELLERTSGDRLPVVGRGGTLVGLVCLNRDENRLCVDADRAP